MPKVKVNDITINYETQGSGEPLILIPYLAADNACYAFQVPDYAKHFTCISLDPRGAGETDKPEGAYSTELFADDVAAFMAAIGLETAHVSGLSLGGAIGLWLASKIPRAGQDSLATFLLAEERSVPEGRRWRLANHRQGSRQRP
jgi:pimeloyl-ACP methyl ester carboxylesterase